MLFVVTNNLYTARISSHDLAEALVKRPEMTLHDCDRVEWIVDLPVDEHGLVDGADLGDIRNAIVVQDVGGGEQGVVVQLGVGREDLGVDA